MDVPTRRHVVIATYEYPAYAEVEVFETNSILRAKLVARGIADYWRRDLENFGLKAQGFWSVVVEDPIYEGKEGFNWRMEKDREGNLQSLHPSHSIRRFTDDQDLAQGVD